MASCSGSRRPGVSDLRRAIELSGPPCREGLVTAEAQPDIPLRLTVGKSACASPQEVKAEFEAENIGSVTIKTFTVRALGDYDRAISIRKGVDIASGVLKPHQTTTGIVGTGTGDPKATLTSCKLTVWSITYADGQTWNRSPVEKPAR